MAGIADVPELVVGIAAGAAASAALEPALEIPKQDAWDGARNRILDPDLLARLVAQGGVDLGTAHYFAHRNGFDDDQFAGLVYMAQTVPGVAEAMTLWRLGIIQDSAFTHTLVKAGLEQQFIDAIFQSKTDERPGIGDIAYAVVRGYLPTNIPLPVAPPTTSTNVKRFPQSSKLAETWAQEIGYDANSLELFIARSGLSMAPGLAAQAFFRGILADDDYQLAIAEGDLRTEWGHALREASRAIPSPSEYAELQLRGFTDAAGRDAGAALHGMVSADAQRLYNVKGRGPNIHAVTTGLARGGTYDGQPKTIPEPFLSAVQRQDIRPEWYDIEYANRYTYPSAFVMRALAQAGDLGGQAQVEQDLLELGWKPSFATKVSTAWTAPSAAKTDPHVVKAQGQLYTEAHKAYVKTGLSQAQVTPALNLLAVPAAAQTEVFSLWDMEKQLAAEVPAA